jgi:hypothetical protein
MLSISTLYRISETTGVSLDWLVGKSAGRGLADQVGDYLVTRVAHATGTDVEDWDAHGGQALEELAEREIAAVNAASVRIEARQLLMLVKNSRGASNAEKRRMPELARRVLAGLDLTIRPVPLVSHRLGRKR